MTAPREQPPVGVDDDQLMGWRASIPILPELLHADVASKNGAAAPRVRGSGGTRDERATSSRTGGVSTSTHARRSIASSCVLALIWRSRPCTPGVEPASTARETTPIAHPKRSCGRCRSTPTGPISASWPPPSPSRPIGSTCYSTFATSRCWILLSAASPGAAGAPRPS